MSHVEGDGTLANADIRLFESGDLADATIVCGDRTWNVHKVIVSSRCKWFKAAFYGNMAEATSGKVVLEEQDPDVIDILLRYIYGKDISIPMLRNGDDIPILCVQIYRVGDFFLLEDLKNKAAAELESHIENTLTLLDADTGDGQTPKWLTEILNAIKDAYKDRSTAPTRYQLLKFTCLNKNKIFGFEDAIALIDEIPEVARDLIKGYFAGDMAAQLRPPQFRLGLPVLAAVQYPNEPYELDTTHSGPAGSPKIPYLLYPCVDSDITIFAVVDPKTNKESMNLWWMAPIANSVTAMASHPDSEVVRVQMDTLGPPRVLYIRFAHCGDARLYVERYCRANPEIDSFTANRHTLGERMRLRVDRAAGRS